MRIRFKQLVAAWFVLQIVVPFTAPLQTCDLRDLLGTKTPHSHPASPESSTTPTIGQAEVAASPFGSPIEAPAWSVATSTVTVGDPAAARRLNSAGDLSPSPEVQRTVLRL